MIKWKKLSFADKPLIDRHLADFPIGLSDYPFTNLWMWDLERQYHIALVIENLCIRFQNNKKEEIFLYPIGKQRQLETIVALEHEQKISGKPFLMRAIPEKEIEALFALPFPYLLQAEENRFDYVYSFKDLLFLRGNRYQAKRNLIYQFEQNYDFTYQAITPSLLPFVIKMEEKWYQEHRERGPQWDEEHQAVLQSLKVFFELNLIGGALLVQQEVIAFSFAEQISPSTWLIHVEKAFPTLKGAYQMMNQQLLRHLKPLEFVNREENLGNPNLAKVKNSYHPKFLLKKFTLRNR